MYYFLLLFFRATVRELKRLDANQRSPLYALISETLSGIPSIRAFRAETKFIARQRLLTDLSNSPRYLYLCTAIWISLRIEILASFIILTISLLGVSSAIEPSLIGLTLSYGFGVVDQVGFLLKSLANLESEMNAVERLEVYANSVPVEASASLLEDPEPGQWPTDGAIKINGLEVRYPSRPDYAVLKGITLDIAAGEKVSHRPLMHIML